MVTKLDIACFIYRGITLNEDILENDDIEAIYMESQKMLQPLLRMKIRVMKTEAAL